MASQKRLGTSIGLGSVVGQSQTASNMAGQSREPSLAEQVAAAAARKGWLSPPPAPASQPQATVPRGAGVQGALAPEALTGIINRLTGDYSDYTADPATARAFARFFPDGSAPAPDAGGLASLPAPAVPTLAQSLAASVPQSEWSLLGPPAGPAAQHAQGAAPAANPLCPPNVFMDALGKLHAAPLTAAGLLAGYVGGVGQEFAGGPNVHVGIGNNAIQFTGFTGGEPVGFTLGNAQLYGANSAPEGQGSKRGRYDRGTAIGSMGAHEEAHTYQHQNDSLAYLAYQNLMNRRSAKNPYKVQADDYADKGPRCPK